MGARILLVDDAQDLLDAYVAFLHGTTSYEVRTAASSAAALQILRTWRPDIVVTDLSMPDMDGLELITRIRSELPPPLPVIVAASGFPDFEREARRRGAQVFQAKPIDTDDLVALIESLLADREPPDAVRTHTEARRRLASERARAAVSTALAHRPHFREAARLGMLLLARYYDGADAAILLMGEEGPHVFASSGGAVGEQPDGVLGYALDVVASGSTLIVPDLAAMPGSAAQVPGREWRLFAAVPVRSAEGLAIGALALADRRAAAFDVHDLALLEHVARRLGVVFSGTHTPGILEGPGILVADSWRHCLGCEVRHLAAGRTLVIALASIPGEATLPGASAEETDHLARAIGTLIERLPPRTALGRLTAEKLAAYSLVEQASAGEQALLSLIATLDDATRGSCIGVLSTTGLVPPDSGAALLDIAEWLLEAAKRRGPSTTLPARLAPAVAERLAA